MRARTVVAVAIPTVILALVWSTYDPKSGTASDPGSPVLAMRVESSMGILAVTQAANPTANPRPDHGYFGVWLDDATERTYSYDALLYTDLDLGHFLLDLEKRLNVDLSELETASTQLAGAVAAARAQKPQPTRLIFAFRGDLAKIMGFSFASVTKPNRLVTDGDGDGAVSSLLYPNPCNDDYSELLDPDPPMFSAALALASTELAIPCDSDCPAGDRCCDGRDECCGSPDPCCDPSDDCCGNPDRCCNPDNPCCESDDPCCNNDDPCCGNPDPCCNPDNPCCESGEGACCLGGNSCCNDPDPCCNDPDPCCGSPDECCGDDDPCCDPTDECCGDPDECCDPQSPCCGSGQGPCCNNPDPCCNDPDPCCGSGDPCCDPTDECCGDPDECCDPESPCCGSGQGPCCESGDPCCNDPDPCCDPNDPCCGSSDPCCGTSDPCCGSTDPCCGQDPCCEPNAPCCGSSDPCCGDPDPCCGDPDPCCGDPDPCCDNTDPCDPLCGTQCPDDEPCITYCCDPNGGCDSDALKSGCTADQFLTEEVCPGGTILSGVVLCAAGACDTNYTWVVAQTGGSAMVNGASGSTYLPAGSCTDVEFDLDVSIDSPAGTATMLFTATAEYGGNCLPPSSLSCNVSATMTVWTIDLDVDSNNDGVIADADDIGEDAAFTPQTPGKWLWLNRDDSNADSLADNLNQVIDGATDLEDIAQLVLRPIDTTGLAAPTLTLTLGDPTILRVFPDRASTALPAILGPNAGGTANFPSGLDQPGDLVLGMEGIASGTTTILMELFDGTERICEDTVRVTVIDVSTVEWLDDGFTPIVNPNDHPSAPLGIKVFPGAPLPGDLWNDLVVVRATVQPMVQGVPLHLKALDPDDPSARNDVVDGDLLGGDNRDANHGDSAELSDKLITTDGAGTAASNFLVAHQPGDNHRIAVTPKQAELALLTDDDVPPSQTDPPTVDQPALFVGHVSDLLTVWRTLHVETDTMVRPLFAQNTFTMNWNEPIAGAVSTQVIFDVDDPPLEGGQTVDGQFVNGYVDLQDVTGTTIITARIIDYVTVEVSPDPDDQVTINILGCGNGQSGLDCLGGVTVGKAILSDDDLSVLATFTAGQWGCDDVFAGPIASLLPPDLNALQSRYHWAYIDPVHDLATSDVQGLVIFLRNQGFGFSSNWGKALWDQALAARDLPVSSVSFWAVMVVSAWQAEEPEDNDPDTEVGESPGLTLGISTHSDGSTTSHIGLASQYTGICTVFKAVFDEGGFGNREQYTVAHEVGHTLGLAHADGGLMCDTGVCQTHPFTATSLKKLREYDGP